MASVTAARSLVAVVALVIVSGAGIAQELSLADLAKKEQERRKSAKQPAKVYTKASDKPNEEVNSGNAHQAPVAKPSDSNPLPSTSSPTPSPAAPNEPKTESMRKKATTAFAPTLLALSRRADTLDANFRRYLDACFLKFTRGTSTGISTGSGLVRSEGVVVGRDWFIAWEANNTVRWQESWVSRSDIDNETTVQCRVLWSDIEHDATVIREEVDDVEEAARRAGIYPGVIRELRAKYRLAW